MNLPGQHLDLGHCKAWGCWQLSPTRYSYLDGVKEPRVQLVTKLELCFTFYWSFKCVEKSGQEAGSWLLVWEMYQGSAQYQGDSRITAKIIWKTEICNLEMQF